MKLCGLLIAMLFLTACLGPVPPPPAPDTIEGTLIDGRTHAARAGLVTLQQPDSGGTFRVVRQTNSDVRGRFSFMSVPAGTYLLLAVSYTMVAPDLFSASAPSVITAVSPGTRVEDLPLFPIGPIGTLASNTTSLLTGDVVTDAVSSDVTISSFQELPCPPWAVCALSVPRPLATIPQIVGLNRGSNITTQVGGPSCPPGVACGTYDVTVPAANIVTVQSPVRNSPFFQATTNIVYGIEAFSATRGTMNSNCFPSTLPILTGGVVPGSNPPLPPIIFSSCH